MSCPVKSWDMSPAETIWSVPSLVRALRRDDWRCRHQARPLLRIDAAERETEQRTQRHCPMRSPKGVRLCSGWPRLSVAFFWLWMRREIGMPSPWRSPDAGAWTVSAFRVILRPRLFYTLA